MTMGNPLIDQLRQEELAVLEAPSLRTIQNGV